VEIPISRIGENFASFIGDNGIGKSSILEAINILFNGGEWNINLAASAKRGLNSERAFPFISAIFCIKKSRVTKSKKIFEEITKYFLSAKKPFLKEIQNYSKIDEYYILVAGKRYFTNKSDSAYFGSFDKEIKELLQRHNNIDESSRKIDRIYEDYLSSVLNLYSYIYIPTEVSIEEFSRIEKDDIQKLTGTNIYNEIQNIITTKKLDEINIKLGDLVDNKIAKELKEYQFRPKGGKGGRKNIVMNSLINKIIEEYFSLRVMIKESLKSEPVNVRNLSSGEKRKALIELSKAFLKTQKNNKKDIILAIDEPEASLNIKARFSQFEDLNSIKNISNNIQVLISTHWYGHLSIVDRGIVNLIHRKNNNLEVTSYDLFNITEKLNQDNKNNRAALPNDITLKSVNDLTQSIIASLQANQPYNWLICEGSSEKIYFDYYLKELIEDKNLRILPVGGFREVKKIYEHLLLPLRDYKNSIEGRVYCLIDTDKKKLDFKHDDNPQIPIVFRRLLNEKGETHLQKNNYDVNTETEIEDCLNGKAFIETLKRYNDIYIHPIINDLKNIKDINRNSFYCFDLRDSDKLILKKFFDLDKGYRKIDFAKKYIEVIKEQDYVVPKWIEEIKRYF
jgi:predicted ATPase